MKTALVTGSTSGIGLAIAEKLAKAGFNLCINGFGDLQEINKLCLQLSDEFNITTVYHPADLSKKEQVTELIEYTYKTFNKIDVLVNNAGIQYVSPIEEFPDAKWQQIIDINLSAVFYSIKHALPIMRQQQWGRIINIASTHGQVASVNKSAYVASKHGIIGLTKVTALETAGSGITCNAICPGWVHTPLVQKQIDAIAEQNHLTNEEATIKLLAEKQPSKIFTKPGDIGDMVVFLTTEAGNNITGTNLTLDGGWTAQ
ncbi:3-hydroxybutyrate dehydrogenase [Rickettsiales endosymbiont of Stachyamoeba lipophora]|uniref:3-hydroxybutyrate dehydrogenase n=1 Tax=Rickettsiales endosymbiont of Stachyamoeba lipophora TaxID=2486578 RepID=UPI000F6545AD|nr:3-hydroxybutyrate dehydrogenase [Rickettsiales endosymbiont of Stachyamoeba lipophora]AZL15125.1 3-hydroxybutyrate dehydrogenase [Rickettsiales endosymbiont of Stachyamoeba lipophora]